MELQEYKKEKAEHMRIFSLLDSKFKEAYEKAGGSELDVRINVVSGADWIVAVRSDKGLALVDLSFIKTKLEEGEDEDIIINEAVEKLLAGEDGNNTYVNILDRQWVKENVQFVLSNDSEEAAKCISKQVADDVYLIAGVKITVDGKHGIFHLDELYRDMMFTNDMSEKELLEWAEKNTESLEAKVTFYNKGMCCISPGVRAFVGDMLETAFADVDEHGLYVFPYSVNQVMLLNNTEVNADEAKALFKGSLQDLEDLKAINETEKLAENVLMYREGKLYKA